MRDIFLKAFSAKAIAMLIYEVSVNVLNVDKETNFFAEQLNLPP